MARVTRRRMVLSVEGKFEVIWEINKGKKYSWPVSGIWSRKFCDPKD